MAGEEWPFVEHRAKALATVFLTARNNIRTYDVKDFGGIDFLARIDPVGGRFERLFGVVLKSTTNPLPTEKHANNLLNSWARQTPLLQVFPFPVLILIFSMQEDDGYYDWQVEPLASIQQPALNIKSTFKTARTNKKALDIISQEIEMWYSKYYANVNLNVVQGATV